MSLFNELHGIFGGKIFRSAFPGATACDRGPFGEIELFMQRSYLDFCLYANHCWLLSEPVGLFPCVASSVRPGGLDPAIHENAFVTSQDVVACLRDGGLDIAAAPTSKRDLAKIQDQLNAWAKETGLPYRHLSMICAMSIGENHERAGTRVTLSAAECRRRES